ncbi:hypothetical protein [Solimonas marina]|uniref:Uncharacterized protein n=1 Tax=Solimonas marina TaxID=2714601 RepID=A0A969W7V0_9GAMM|nr:hypothetical protein [Solimonas marina]NKF21583.1 hypothetical protein [Solimonas marina]
MNFVTCSTCGHWSPDSINPAHGMGSCALGCGHWSQQAGPHGRAGPPYPHAERTCAEHTRQEPRHG